MAMMQQMELHYRTLLKDTFGMVMRISQWCCTAPYPLEPYQRISPSTRQSLRLHRLLKQVLSAATFSVIFASPFLLYFLHSKTVFMFAVPLSIKIMYYMQTALQLIAMMYVLFVYQFRTRFHRYCFERVVHVLEQIDRPDMVGGLRTVKRTVYALLGLSVLQISLLFVEIFLYNPDWGHYLKIVTLIVAHLIGRTITLQYVTILCTIAALLRPMNDTLESLLDTNLPQTGQLTVEDRATIEKIRFLHLELLGVVAKTNSTEGLGLLLTTNILGSFIYINIGLLQIYQGVSKGTMVMVVTFVINTALKFGVFIMIAFSNRLVQKQNLRVSNLLLQLNKLDNGVFCYTILNRFITQTGLFLSVHETSELMSVDMTLLYNVVGGILSIFVVLVQFADSYEKV